MTALIVFMLWAKDHRAEILLHQIAVSGQIIEIASAPAERLAPPARIAPGAPPLLEFRLIEGKLQHRFGGLGLVLDDAGH